MNYKTLLFDADNTLFDYDAAEKAAISNTFEQFSIPNTEHSRSVYKKHNDRLWKSLELGQVGKDELKWKRFALLLDELQLDADPHVVSIAYTKELGKGTQLLPGAEELCATLAKEYTIIIVTNGIHEVQESRIGNSDIVSYISKVYTSEGIGFTKPDKRFFEYVLEDLSIENKSETIVIGDSLSADIKGAMNAEIDACWYNPNNLANTLEEEPKYIISDYEALLEILK